MIHSYIPGAHHSTCWEHEKWTVDRHRTSVFYLCYVTLKSSTHPLFFFALCPVLSLSPNPSLIVIALCSHHPNFLTLPLSKLIMGNLITLLPPTSPLPYPPIPSPCSPPCTPIHLPCPISHSIFCLSVPVSLSHCPSGCTQPQPKPYTMQTAVLTIRKKNYKIDIDIPSSCT